MTTTNSKPTDMIDCEGDGETEIIGFVRDFIMLHEKAQLLDPRFPDSFLFFQGIRP
jgi:hypothetical protein